MQSCVKDSTDSPTVWTEPAKQVADCKRRPELVSLLVLFVPGTAGTRGKLGGRWAGSSFTSIVTVNVRGPHKKRLEERKSAIWLQG